MERGSKAANGPDLRRRRHDRPLRFSAGRDRLAGGVVRLVAARVRHFAPEALIGSTAASPPDGQGRYHCAFRRLVTGFSRYEPAQANRARPAVVPPARWTNTSRQFRREGGIPRRGFQSLVRRTAIVALGRFRDGRSATRSEVSGWRSCARRRTTRRFHLQFAVRYFRPPRFQASRYIPQGKGSDVSCSAYLPSPERAGSPPPSGTPAVRQPGRPSAG